MHRTGTGTKHIVRHIQRSAVQWSVISKFTCTTNDDDDDDDCDDNDDNYNKMIMIMILMNIIG